MLASSRIRHAAASLHSSAAPARVSAAPRSAVRTMATEKRVLVPIADGSEEMEAVITINVLRRAGAQVTVASLKDTLEIKGSRGINIVADKLISDVQGDSFDLIACPGGMPGAENMRDNAILERMVKSQLDSGKMYAAICATPFVFLQTKGLLDGKKATAHPAFAEKLADQSRVSERVVVDGNLTTSRGPGTSFEFALSLVKQLFGEEKMQQVAGPMVMPPS